MQISMAGLDYSATGKGFTLPVKENVTGTTATTGKISPVALSLIHITEPPRPY